MDLIAELMDEHRELQRQTARLLHAISAEVPDPAGVAVIRWQFAQALFDHCSREDRSVYDRLLACGDVTATTIAWRYRQEFGELAREFALYISEWPVDRIVGDWKEFGADTRLILELLASRIEREEEVLYPQALRIMERRDAA